LGLKGQHGSRCWADQGQEVVQGAVALMWMIFYVDIEERFWCADKYVLIFLLPQTDREKGKAER